MKYEVFCVCYISNNIPKIAIIGWKLIGCKIKHKHGRVEKKRPDYKKTEGYCTVISLPIPSRKSVRLSRKRINSRIFMGKSTIRTIATRNKNVRAIGWRSFYRFPPLR